MPTLTPAGGDGPARRARAGRDVRREFLTAEQVGDAVLALADEREPALWTVDATQLSMVTSVPIGV